MILKRLMILLLAMFVVIINSCSRPVDNEGFILIDTEDNPSVLPYQFVRITQAHSLTYPIRLSGDTRSSIYNVQNRLHTNLHHSAVIFALDKSRGANILKQANINTDKIISHIPYDFDKDSIEELAITYVTQDSLWLEILDAFEKPIIKKLLVAGIDHNKDGRWDGRGYIYCITDLNCDGYSDIIVTCNTGFDLYPRRLICLDWFNNTILWQFDVPGVLRAEYNDAVIYEGDKPEGIVCGVGSVCNGLELIGMDDSHSYLTFLNMGGKLKWVREVGGKFSGAIPVVIDYGLDGNQEILLNISLKKQGEYAADGLVVYNLKGDVVDSIHLSHKVADKALIDIDNDGIKEICIFLYENTVYVYTQSLQLIRKYRFNKTFRQIHYCRDFLGNGENQILASCGGGDLWLFNQDFKPLARLVGGNLPRLLSTETGIPEIIARTESTSWYYILQMNSWYRVFIMKYKNHIAVILCLLLGGLATSIFYQRRTKSHLEKIAFQKKALEKTHRKLRETQKQLIAAEKYRQAKDIAGGVAHEIHNALNPARHSLEMLRKQFASGAKVNPKLGSDLVELTEESVTRGLKMTELVTAYSRLESEKSNHSVNLESLLSEVVLNNKVTIRNLGASLEIQIVKGSCLPYNKAHAYSLFNNLMLNSLDALANMSTRIINISANKKNDFLRIEFTDTGHGIEPEIVSRIFDLFFSTKPNTGTGVGLAMVKKIVELYDGRIEVKSTLDKGTKFIILQPIA